MREETATLDYPVAETAADELNIYELERGKPMPNLTHGAIQANLVIALDRAAHAQFRIASEVALDTQPVGSTPDVVLYPERELNFVNELAKRPDAPLLTVEIQSPSQSTDEMVEKVFRYFEFGVQSAWIVVPVQRAIFVYDRTGMYRFFHHDEVLVDETLGIEIPLSKVFA